jgi:hypothetical protein
MNLWIRRLAELGGMAMIGDGFLATVNPQGHVRLWERGPWRGLLKPFADHPELTRVVGMVEVLAGTLLAGAAIEGRTRRDA